MDLIHTLNNSIGIQSAHIETSVSKVDGIATSALEQIGVGKLGYSPIPVLRPNTSLTAVDTHWICPVALALASHPEDKFWLPTDPQVSIKGGNSIVKREIANGNIRGSVKEMWRNNDWTISIAGILMPGMDRTENTEKDLEYFVKRLAEICNARENIIIDCDKITSQLGITQICIESMDFPATDGEDCQAFSITAVSDDSYTLQID